MDQRKIIHIDMDCFFAQVELKKRPELKGKPVAVGGLPGNRGVIAAADYEARKYGVKSAMPSGKAVKLCPSLVILPPDFKSYKETSRKIRAIFERYAKEVEPLSLDEAFLEVSDSKLFDGSATLLASHIRKEILDETGLTASAGIAPNKFLAKIASDWKKPNGQWTVSPKMIDDFVVGLPVEKIFGVGPVTASKMKKRGYYTCGDLQKLDQLGMSRLFGAWGGQLYNLCRGIDHRAVSGKRVRKSISVESTYNTDIEDRIKAEELLAKLFTELSLRVERAKVSKDKIKGFFVKIKFYNFETTTHESTCKSFCQLEEFKELFLVRWEKSNYTGFRLLGIGYKLKPAQELEDAGEQINFPDELLSETL